MDSSSTQLIMNRLNAQASLFPEKLSRLKLNDLDLDSELMKNVTINVWRNHAIESVISIARPFFAYAGIEVDFCLSDYDDSLVFDGRIDSDLELLWIDSDRYLKNISCQEWLEWLSDRVRVLRSKTEAPIVIATWVLEKKYNPKLLALANRLPDVYFADIGELCEVLGIPLKNNRTAEISGTILSNAAQLNIARKLACHWLSSLVLPPVKAVVLDLDNTLHDGVLGEDDAKGVKLTMGHLSLQAFVKDLKERGIFITLVSRNEPADVIELFKSRTDYILKWEDFSATEVSWNEKGPAITSIASKLRIAPDAMLFVDDNPGELISAGMQLPNLHMIYATPDAEQTKRSMEYYPGIWRWRVENDDRKRIDDFAANLKRDRYLINSASASEYFRSLKVRLTIRQDHEQVLGRLADLCNKTNQFNLALRRFNQAELAIRMNSEAANVACVQLKDRLSDSGVIAVVVGERDGDRLRIEELCISCRALGRRLEDTIILMAIRSMSIYEGCKTIQFRVERGPRNDPSVNWIGNLIGSATNLEPGLHELPLPKIENFRSPDDIEIIVNQAS